MNLEVANRLLKYRKKSGYSQEDLASKIGVSRQAVSKWERSEASPDTDNLMLLADIYGVTIDQLLKEDPADETEENPQEVADESAEENVEEKVEETTETDEETDEEKQKKVSFKKGIHINDGGDKVDIGWSGIHVHSKTGDKVDIDKNGINVTEADGNPVVYTDEDGKVHKNYSKDEKSKAHRCAEHFPFWLIAIIGFFTFGFCNILGGWVTSWMWFLTIPIYYTTVEAIFKKSLSYFCYPVLAVMLFMWAGFFGGMWHPAWMIFLTIPIFYWIASLVGDNDKEKNQENTEDNAPKKKSNAFKIVIGIVITVIAVNAVMVGVIYAFGENKVITKSFRLNDNYSDNILVDKTSGELNILSSDKDYSYVDYYAEIRGFGYTEKGLKIKEYNYSTEISEYNDFMFFGTKSSNITLYLTDKDYNSLVIDTSSGNTKIQPQSALSIDKLEVDSSSGNVTVDGVKGRSVELDTASGNVKVSGAFSEASVDTASGNVEFTSYNYINKMEVDTASGDVTVSLPDDERGFTLEYDKASGKISSEFTLAGNLTDSEGTVVCGNGEGRYDVDMASGDFKLVKNKRADSLAMRLFYMM